MTAQELKIKPKRKYKTQNDKVWTINFSKLKFVQKAQLIIPVLKKRVGLRSMGLTIMLTVEYCLQEHVLNEFLAFVNTRRRGLLD